MVSWKKPREIPNDNGVMIRWSLDALSCAVLLYMFRRTTPWCVSTPRSLSVFLALSLPVRHAYCHTMSVLREPIAEGSLLAIATLLLPFSINLSPTNHDTRLRCPINYGPVGSTPPEAF